MVEFKKYKTSLVEKYGQSDKWMIKTEVYSLFFCAGNSSIIK